MTQKQRALVTLLAMLVVAGGLGGAAWWSTKHDEAQKQAEDQAAQLFTFDRNQASEITIVANGQTTVLKKGDDGWGLIQPVQARADGAAVDGILARLTTLRSKSTIEPHATQLAKFGLDKPQAKVTVAYTGGKAELTLGAENSYSGAQYVMKGGSDAILLAEGSSTGVLARSTFDLREKQVLAFNEADLKKIEVEAKPDVYTLEREGEGWNVTAPRALKADPDSVRKVIGAIENLRASAFPDENPSAPNAYGLAQPLAHVVLTLKDGKQRVVRIGEATVGGQKHRYAQLEGQTAVAEVATEAGNDLHLSLDALEDKTLASFDREKVAAVQLTKAPGLEVLVQRKRATSDAGLQTDTWTQLAPKSGAAKPWKMSSLLYMLGSLKGTRVVAEGGAELAKYGLDKPERTVTLQDNTGKAIVELKFGKEEGPGVYAMSSSDPRVFTVEKSRLGDLPNGPDDLLEQASTPTAAAH